MWDTTLWLLSSHLPGTPRSSKCVLPFRYIDQNSVHISYLSYCYYTQLSPIPRTVCLLGYLASGILRFIRFTLSITHPLTWTMTLSKGDLEFCAARTLSLHHTAPMETASRASGWRVGSNVITLLAATVQSKLQQLSHRAPYGEQEWTKTMQINNGKWRKEWRDEGKKEEWEEEMKLRTCMNRIGEEMKNYWN